MYRLSLDDLRFISLAVLEYWIFDREIHLVEGYRREQGRLVKAITLDSEDTH